VVKVCGQGKAPPSGAQGSAGRSKNEIDEALRNRLKKGMLVELYGELDS